MQIELAYGKTGLKTILPEDLNITVIEPAFVRGVIDPVVALRHALWFPIQSPALCYLVRSTDKVGIVFSDITRPAPNRLMLPAILDELTHVPKENITLFDALGTHRANTSEELRTMIGDGLVENFHIVQNNAFDLSSQVYLGDTTRGHEIWVNRELMECDVKILTGFIEPHFFAGFSGGGKAIVPGMGSQITILGNHDAGMIGNPKSTWGETWGNPIWEEVREIALKVNNTFLLNVALNKRKEITGIFAGSLEAAHRAGCSFVKQKAMIPVDQPFDIVIATNSGYPLDLNLYQAVKGMSAAAQIVRERGSIIIAAECRDGIPEHSSYRELLRQSGNPHALIETINTPGFLKQDQWQAQIQAQIQLKADVYVHSNNLTAGQIESALLRQSVTVEDTVAALLHKYGHDARICILPEGPQTIPYLC